MLEFHASSSLALQSSRTVRIQLASQFAKKVCGESDSNVINCCQRWHAVTGLENYHRLYCRAKEPINALDHVDSQKSGNQQLNKNSDPGWQTSTNTRLKCTFMTLLALTTVWSNGPISCADDSIMLKNSGQIPPTVITNSILRYGNYCGPGPAEVSSANDCSAVQGLPTVDAVDRQAPLDLAQTQRSMST